MSVSILTRWSVVPAGHVVDWLCGVGLVWMSRGDLALAQGTLCEGRWWMMECLFVWEVIVSSGRRSKLVAPEE